MIDELQAKGGFVDLDKSLKLGRPELRVTPDREKAAALGVDARTLASTIQAMIGGMDVATSRRRGHRYDIRVRLDEKDRNEPAAIERLYARTRDGRHRRAPQPRARSRRPRRRPRSRASTASGA